MRIREELEYLLLKKSAAELRFEDVDPLFYRCRKSVRHEPALAGRAWRPDRFEHQLELAP